MLSAINTLNFLLPVLYIMAFSAYLFVFLKKKELFPNIKRVFLFLALCFHIFYLLSRTIEFNHPPITNKFEIFTVLAFAIGFSYFLLELLTDIRGTGAFILAFSVIFQIISSAFIQNNYVVPEVLRDRSLGLHVFSALLGYSGFILSAVYGVLFLLLYKNIKKNNYGLIFERLPNLEILEKMCFVSAVIGFFLLTIAIVIGIIWLPQAFPDYSYFDPKLISTFLVWLIYGFGILSKLTANWYGRKFILFSLTGFAIAMLSLITTHIFVKTFHSFY